MLGVLRPAGERQVALEHRPVRVADDRVEVIPGPERVVAEPVDERRRSRGATAQSVYCGQTSAPSFTPRLYESSGFARRCRQSPQPECGNRLKSKPRSGRLRSLSAAVSRVEGAPAVAAPASASGPLRLRLDALRPVVGALSHRRRPARRPVLGRSPHRLLGRLLRVGGLDRLASCRRRDRVPLPRWAPVLARRPDRRPARQRLQHAPGRHRARADASATSSSASSPPGCCIASSGPARRSTPSTASARGLGALGRRSGRQRHGRRRRPPGSDDVISFDATPHIWRTWFLGDISGALIVVPFAIAWSELPSLRLDRPALDRGRADRAAASSSARPRPRSAPRVRLVYLRLPRADLERSAVRQARSDPGDRDRVRARRSGT